MKNIFKKITKHIEENSHIIIVSHKGMDLDAIGSSLCLYKIVENFGKKPYIFLDDIKNNQIINKTVEKLKEKKNFVTHLLSFMQQLVFFRN